MQLQITVYALLWVSSASTQERACHLEGFETPARCVSLEVPLDYDAPRDKTIAIAAAIVPALTARPAPDPLFVFAGGPGQAGTAMAAWLDSAFRPARRARDIVLVDFRGTGLSGALSCELPNTSSTEVLRKAGASCAARHGAGARFYTHREVVEDIEHLRSALGYGAINIWGGSFGTRAAQHYIRKYGEHVRSAVLDGATPVGESIFATAHRTGQIALDRLLDACAADRTCAAAHPQLREDLQQLLARAETEVITNDPQTGKTTHATLDRDTVVSLIRGALYVGFTRDVLPLAVSRAARGDFAPLLALGAATRDWSMNTMAAGFMLGILCSEDVAQSNREPRAEKLSSGFMRDSYYRGFAASCESWPAKILPENMFARLDQTIPALAISGELDPVTPPSSGEVTLAQFATRVHVIVPHGYHTNSSNTCVAEIIAQFLADPLRGGRDHECLEKNTAPGKFFIPAGEGRTK